ncbi:MAG: type II toxin-antitoxin system VapC family toxin [Firmicutes bacterium]|nr:type II toxin-antitoxin system VapC family toxin [Bacillota bacterium]
MRTFFLDTSAFFKLYVPEQGAQVLQQIFQNGGLRLITSLTITEMMSNLRRLLEVDQVIDEKAYRAIKADMMGKIADGSLEVIEITLRDILDSIDLIEKRYMSPIDSIQLASALRVFRRTENLVFVCADAKLARLASDEGLEVLNPLQASSL